MLSGVRSRKSRQLEKFHSDLVSTIAYERKHGNLSSAIRLFVLDHYRRLAERKRKGK
jgi:predicted DNA-binding ribbon-helix-helix protein